MIMRQLLINLMAADNPRCGDRRGVVKTRESRGEEAGGRGRGGGRWTEANPNIHSSQKIKQR